MNRSSVPVVLLVAAIVGSVAVYVWPFLALFSPSEAALVLGLGVGIVLVAWLPLLYPLFMTLRSKPRLPWRIRFVGVVGSLTYGASLLVAAVVGVPLELYLVHVAPQLQAMGESVGEPVVLAGEFILSYGWIAAPIVLSVASVVLTRYLLPRWPAVVAALGG